MVTMIDDKKHLANITPNVLPTEVNNQHMESLLFSSFKSSVDTDNNVSNCLLRAPLQPPQVQGEQGSTREASFRTYVSSTNGSGNDKDEAMRPNKQTLLSPDINPHMTHVNIPATTTPSRQIRVWPDEATVSSLGDDSYLTSHTMPYGKKQPPMTFNASSSSNSHFGKTTRSPEPALTVTTPNVLTSTGTFHIPAPTTPASAHWTSGKATTKTVLYRHIPAPAWSSQVPSHSSHNSSSALAGPATAAPSTLFPGPTLQQSYAVTKTTTYKYFPANTDLLGEDSSTSLSSILYWPTTTATSNTNMITNCDSPPAACTSAGNSSMEIQKATKFISAPSMSKLVKKEVQVTTDSTSQLPHPKPGFFYDSSGSLVSYQDYNAQLIGTIPTRNTNGISTSPLSSCGIAGAPISTPPVSPSLIHPPVLELFDSMAHDTRRS